MQPFIGSRIKLYRSMAGKTQEQLSAELDVTKQHLGLIERGECNPSLDLLKRTCQTLGVSPANFFLGCSCESDSCIGGQSIREGVDIDPVTSCGTWVVNLSGGKISWSESLHRLLGESPRLKPSLKRFTAHIAPRFRTAFLEYYKHTLASREARSFKCTLKRRGGEERTVQIRADIVSTGQDSGDLALFSVLDISDLQVSRRLLLYNQHNLENIVQDKTKSLRLAADGLKEQLERRSRAETLLREKSEQIERFIEAVPAIMYKVSLDDFRCEYLSSHARTILGDDVGGEIEDGRLPWHAAIHPDDAPLVAGSLCNARDGRAFVIEYRVLDQSSRWRWFRDEGAPKKDAGGRQVLHGVVTDITESKTVEGELEKSRAMLVEAEALAGLGCVEYDVDAAMWTVSDNWCRITGSTKRRVSPREMLGFVLPEDRSAVKRAIVNAMKSRPYNIVHRIARQDSGEIVHVHGYGKVEFEGGRPRRFFGAALDITAYREVSSALTESEANFRSFFETVDDIILIVDFGGAILHANPAAVAKTGYPLEKLRRMHIQDLHEHQRRKELQDILDGMVSGARNSCDLPIVSGDGRLIPVESRAWRGKWNGTPCLYGISKVQLRVSSSLLRLICDNVPDMIWAKDLDNRYIFANTAFCRDLLCAADTGEPIGKTDLFFAERERGRHAENPDWHTFGEICRDTDRITLDTGCPQQFDEYGNVKGRFMFLDVHKAPLYDDQGIMIGTVGSAREVTEERRMAQALEASNKALVTILDSMPADVYVSDMATRRVLFMNKHMKGSFGRDCTGEICHEAFRDSVGPCSFCTSPDLLDWEGKPVGTISWERFNPVSGRWYINYDQAIEWIDGSEARIQMAMDITDRKNAEDSLRTERDLFSAGPVVTFVWDPAPGWPVRYVSGNCEAVLGYTGAELTAESFTYDSLIHPDDLERVRGEVAAHFRDGVDRFEQSYRLRTKDGHYAWVFDFTKVDRDEAGRPASICGYMFDQSRLKEVESALGEERRRLADIIEGTDAGTWEWNVLTGETTFNSRCAGLIGYTLEELGPVSARTWMRYTHPDDLHRCMRLLERHFDSETSHYEAEIRMRHKDGRWVWILARGKVASWTPDGRPVMMRGTHQDISERKAAEEGLRRTNSFLEAIIDALPGSLSVVDTDYNVLISNASKCNAVLGSVADCVRACGRKCYDVFQHRTSPCPWCRVGDVLATGQPVSEVTGPDDPREQAAGRAFQVHLNPVKDDAGNMLGVVEYGTDITELRRAREQAMQASISKSTFLANMSHDIRTLLNGVMGMLELLHSRDLGAERAHYAEAAHQTCRRLMQLLSDILDLSRVEAGMLRLANRPMDIRDVLVQTRDLFAPEAGRKGIALRLAVDPAIPSRLSGDPDRLQQVLANIVGNALKFTANGSVDIEAWLLPRRFAARFDILLCVTDTGTGIDDAKLDRLFEPFSQLGDEYVSENRGVGLGLSICRELVELMGGNISIQSRSGEGTSVCCGLPFGPAENEANPDAADTENQAERDIRGLRVLLVEDDELSALAAARLLQKRGAQVHHVRDGLPAIDALRNGRYDLVLMDIQLPEMDGIAAIRAIRQGEAGADAASLPVIVLTAHAMSGEREKFEAAGADGYMSKPFETGQLVRLISEIRPA